MQIFIRQNIEKAKYTVTEHLGKGRDVYVNNVLQYLLILKMVQQWPVKTESSHVFQKYNLSSGV